MLAALLTQIDGEKSRTNYPWPKKFPKKFRDQIIEEDRELLELVSTIMAAGVLDNNN